MVCKVKSGKNIKGALNYNENKVKIGVAECIGAENFIVDPENLRFCDKLSRFEHLTEKNTRAKTNCVHISLNFDVKEKLSHRILNEIAEAYMYRIGFGNQPYLVYEHRDAAHPHLHIVTTNIQEDGKRISIHNLGKNQSENARKEIEKEYGLVIAAEKKQKLEINPFHIEKVIYGKSETKTSISDIVSAVTRSYKYTSLAELNAVLKQYNIVADRGIEGTKMFENKGLVYCLLDRNGEKIGVPIKASSIKGKPTIKHLEKQFQVNELLRRPYQQSVKNCIEEFFNKSIAKTRETFTSCLKEQFIDVVFRENKEGRIYGVTFIDHANKVVFNGSDLGKGFSASQLLARLPSSHSTGRSVQFNETLKKTTENAQTIINASFNTNTDSENNRLIEDLVSANSNQGNYVEPSLKKRKKRKNKMKGYKF